MDPERIEPLPVDYDRAKAKRIRRTMYVRSRAARLALQEWLLQKIANIGDVIRRERAYVREHPNDWASQRQLDFWVAYQAAVRHLVHHAGRLPISKTKGVEIDPHERYKKPRR